MRNADISIHTQLGLCPAIIYGLTEKQEALEASFLDRILYLSSVLAKVNNKLQNIFKNVFNLSDLVHFVS